MVHPRRPCLAGGYPVLREAVAATVVDGYTADRFLTRFRRRKLSSGSTSVNY